MLCMIIIRFGRYVCLFHDRAVSVTSRVESREFRAVLPGLFCIKLKIIVTNCLQNESLERKVQQCLQFCEQSENTRPIFLKTRLVFVDACYDVIPLSINVHSS